MPIYLDTLCIFVYNVPMLNKQEILRGLTDTLILAQLYKGDSYGYEINKRIEETCAGMFKLTEATLYTAFRRLEEAELVSSYWGDGDRGARRRYYSISKAGKKLYRENADDWNLFSAAICQLLEQ